MAPMIRVGLMQDPNFRTRIHLTVMDDISVHLTGLLAKHATYHLVLGLLGMAIML